VLADSNDPRARRDGSATGRDLVHSGHSRHLMTLPRRLPTWHRGTVTGRHFAHPTREGLSATVIRSLKAGARTEPDAVLLHLWVHGLDDRAQLRPPRSHLQKKLGALGDLLVPRTPRGRCQLMYRPSLDRQRSSRCNRLSVARFKEMLHENGTYGCGYSCGVGGRRHERALRHAERTQRRKRRHSCDSREERGREACLEAYRRGEGLGCTAWPVYPQSRPAQRRLVSLGVRNRGPAARGKHRSPQTSGRR
jgi:hypothetical protein